MKKVNMVVLGLCCLGLLAPTLASAKGKKDKPTAEQITAAKAILKKYDANSNGILDPDEITKLQADYAAGNESDAAVFDVNNDKTLDDSEIATLQKDLSAGKGKHKKNKSDQ
jgi:hypothetical protein